MRHIRFALAIATLSLTAIACSNTPTSPTSTATTNRTSTSTPPAPTPAPTPTSSLIGTWDGTVSSHPGSAFYGPITSFVLRLTAEPSSSGYIGQWSDNLGCSSGAVIGLVSGGTPSLSVESLRCNDGDFWMQLTSISGNTASGRCRGGSCTFRMVRR